MMRTGFAMLLWGMVSAHAYAFEIFETAPGSRAAALAGAFVAQADDSTAIWYNPAGLKRPGRVRQEYSVDFGTRPRRVDDGDLGTASNVKFAGAYVDHLLHWAGLGVGMSYLTPYVLSFDMNDLVPPFGTTTYGRVRADYRQVSALLSGGINDALSWGGTLDYLWTDVECASVRCVDFGPSGLGASLGAMYEFARSGQQRYTLGAVWRSRVHLNYLSPPASGVGRLLGDYLPDRPQSFTLGANARLPNRYAMVNVNFDVKHVSWAGASTAKAPASDYNRTALGAEAAFPFGNERSVAMRIGAARAASTGGSADARSLVFGAGYAFAAHHAFDLALERRATLADNANFVSVSYSYQQ